MHRVGWILEGPLEFRLETFVLKTSLPCQVMPTQLLKYTLASLLSKFYPAAGRLRRRSSDRKLELVCNNAGVEFVEAIVDGTLDEFDDFVPNKSYTELLDPVPVGFGEDFPEFPITYIQVKP